ncbi:2Fe-2S ferredoxin [Burkholderia sp. MSMB1078WGS]|uniref:Rieske 2Fe-2S domain-containing protein n=1 Tax=Burkholderia sp. MSMB1078WGS TaxID=1637900 RepID=UPI000754749F|nr:Rieske 2Fe-2S domain-containing protein [Burkholderia sp. MSMB1078WGS]KVT12745.1 2Fe-2S ferredoxin [Burkholderia sp. MSMB1078WGS]
MTARTPLPVAAHESGEPGIERVVIVPEPVIEGPRPLPYPNGWFALCFSDELKRASVRAVPFMGSDLVLYRTAAGIAHAVTPYCPHLGAHLGHGGKVDGEDLICPFHGLAYGPDGACVRSPFGPTPPRAALDTWLVRERGGVLLVWRDHLGRAPDWEMPDFDATGFSRARRSCYELGGYAHDMIENSSDIRHFPHLHGFTDVAMRHEVGRHHLTIDLTARWKGVDVHLRMTSHGLGHVHGETDVPRFGAKVITRSYATPTAPLKWTLRWTDVMRVARIDALPPFLRQPLYALLAGIAHHWFVRVVRADFPIWSNRRYLARPMLTAGEDATAALRRWMMQFYPEQPVPRNGGPILPPSRPSSPQRRQS